MKNVLKSSIIAVLGLITFSSCSTLPEVKSGEAGAIPLGNIDAPLTFTAFVDFKCPKCKKYHDESFALLKSEYIDTGKIRYLFRDFTGHSNSTVAHIAAHCAALQNKFSPYADRLFANQEQQGVANYVSYAQELNINVYKFEECLLGQEPMQLIKLNTGLAGSHNIESTPAFIIGDRVITATYHIDDLRAVIEQELNKK